jgi:hypothetical protein
MQTLWKHIHTAVIQNDTRHINMYAEALNLYWALLLQEKCILDYGDQETT